MNFVIYTCCMDVSFSFSEIQSLKLIDQLEKEEKVQIVVMYLRQEWEGGGIFSYTGITSQNIFERFL